jgi:hypothetical protein
MMACQLGFTPSVVKGRTACLPWVTKKISKSAAPSVLCGQFSAKRYCEREMFHLSLNPPKKGLLHNDKYTH